MVPQDAVSWDFDGIMSALRDPAQRLPLLKEVEKWSSESIDAILELAKQGRIEKAWTQMADTSNPIARDKFRRTTSAVPPEIKEATTRRRDALRQRQTCREALAATCLMSSKAWTTELSTTNKTPRTNDNVQGNLLHDYEQKFANLPDHLQLSNCDPV